ncbi:MAG: hypothetical protein ACE5FT_01660 [Candidatus Nanoarchaeia archaeon]
MYKNVFLHHVISLFIFVGYFFGANSLLISLDPTFRSFVGVSRLIGMGTILLLYFVIPVLLYTVGKWYLLPEFGLKWKFKDLLRVNYIMLSVLCMLFLIWFFVGDALYDGTDLVKIVILLLYGLLLLVGCSAGLLFVQCMHVKKKWNKAWKETVKHWHYAFALLVAGVLLISVWSYVPDIYPALPQSSLLLLVAIVLAGYTYWQERLYSSLGGLM